MLRRRSAEQTGENGAKMTGMTVEDLVPMIAASEIGSLIDVTPDGYVLYCWGWEYAGKLGGSPITRNEASLVYAAQLAATRPNASTPRN
jgi:hypothetical protein